MKLVSSVFLLGILVLSPVASGETKAEVSCVEYMAKYGGPCLQGIPEVVYRAKPGVIPADHRVVMGFTLGSDDFGEAVQRFEPAKKWHSGDAVASEGKLCYSATAPMCTMTLVLARNSEMGSSIDEIRMMLGNIESREQCASAGWSADRLRTLNGLGPGLSQAQILERLGPPSNKIGAQMFWNWDEKKTLPPSDRMYENCLFNVVAEVVRGSGVSAFIINGRVEWLTISYGDFLC
jgi:hypothetical protein